MLYTLYYDLFQHQYKRVIRPIVDYQGHP